MTGTARSGGQAVLETLLAWGVNRVFTCPGSTEAAFLDATLDHPDFEVVLTPHESIAVAAADGYARVTGEPTVAYLHTHLGLANGLAHLAAARLARSPVIVLTGLKAALIQAHEGFTTIQNTGRLAEPYVKAQWQSLDTDAIPEDLARALRLSLTEPCGPTWLGLSQDLMDAPCTAEVPGPDRYRPRARTAPDPDRIGDLAELLASAERPLLVAGGEVARHGAVAQLTELSERLGAPVVNEDRRTNERPGFPTSHPHYAGLYEAKRGSVRDSDLIVFVGCRCFMEFDVPTVPDVPPGVRTAHIHTDPTEIGAIYGVDVDIVSDEGLALAALLERLPKEAMASAGHLSRSREEYLAATGPKPPTPEGVENVAAVADALAALIGDDTTVISDGTTFGRVLTPRLPQHPPYQVFGSSSGSLGWGMGAALGIKLALPDREVISVQGDGGFQFGPQALWVAARYGISLIYVIVNNESYAAVAGALHRHGGTAVERGEYPGKDLSGIDIAEISRGYGAFSQRIHRAADLVGAMAKARAHAGPSVIEIMTDPDYIG